MTITEFINRQKFSFVDYFDRKSLMRKKPIAIVYQNGDKVVVSDITRIWSDIYVVCCEMLYNDYKNVFKELAGTSLLNHKNCDIALTGHHRNKMVVPKKIAEDAYVETNYCSFDFIDRITALLSKCGLESNAILIAVVDENLSYTNIIKAHIELNTYVTTNEFKKFYSLNLLCSSEKDKGTEVHYLKSDLQNKLIEIDKRKKLQEEKHKEDVLENLFTKAVFSNDQKADKKKTTITASEKKIGDVKTFSEMLNIPPEGYEDVLVENIPFSIRVSNRIRSGGIITVTDLLQSTPEDLLRIRGFGANSISEVKEYLETLPALSELNIKQKSNDDVKTKKFMLENRESIIKGDFSFLEALQQNDSIKQYIVAYQNLDPELVQKCYHEPDKALTLVNMLDLYCKKYEVQQKLISIVESLPAGRKNNLASGYIKAYIKDTDKRELLTSFCESEQDTLLKMCLNVKITHGYELDELIKFFVWCKFDIVSDIEKIISGLFSNDRNRIVIQMRAQKQTLEQVGQTLGITRERVRQIEVKVKHRFARLQGQLKLISKISAERNDDEILTLDEIRPFCGEYAEEIIFLLKDYNSPNYIFDKTLEVFILSDESPQEQVRLYVDNLPDTFSADELDVVIEMAMQDELPSELIERAIHEAYKLTGTVYHRTVLNLSKIYESILRKYYSEGIHVYDHDALVEFRQYVYEVYGDVNLPQNDRAITARLTDIGILCDKGMYRPKKKTYISSKLSEQIYEYIMNEPNDIILMNILFDAYEQQLIAEGVTNKYYLQGILHEIYGDKLFFRRDYVCKSADSTSFYNAIVDFVKKHTEPVTKQQIQAQFPGVTDIVITLATNESNVLNYFGEYYYAGYLNISIEEKQYLNLLLQTMIEDGKAHHVKELYEIVENENPSIFKRNAAMYPHSAFSILEYLFRDSYEFSRPYIAKRGMQIETSTQQMRDFVYGQEYIAISDIKEFAQEIYYTIYSMINLVDSFNDEYFWLDKDTLVRIDQTGITQEMVHNLENYLLDNLYETTPIANVFIDYRLPNINVEWSDWLLYSVLKKWGTRVEIGTISSRLRYAIPVVAPLGKLDISKYDNTNSEKVLSYPKSDDLDDIDNLIADLIEDDFWGDDDEL